MKNVIIIGSGIGGLISGAYLSKKGYSVTVIEKHSIPGGYATNFLRKSKDNKIFNFDVSLHGIGNLSENRELYKILKELEVFEKIKPIRKKETATLYYKDIKNLDIPDSFNEYQNMLISKFPDEAENIKNLFDFLKKLDEDMEENVYKNNKTPKYFQQLQSITLYDFLKKYTNNEDLIEVFSFLWAYYGLPPSELNALYYLLGWVGYHIGGTFYLEGGGGNFSKALAEIIKENNGKVILKQEVTKLNTINNKVVSVETSKKEVFEGDIFIINGCVKTILSRIDKPNLVKNYIDDLNNLKESISLCQLYIGLNSLPQDLGIVKSDLFFNECLAKDGYNYTLNKDYENVPICVVNYNLLDKNLNPENGVIVVTFVDIIKNWPEYKSNEYQNQKLLVENILLKRLYKLFPKLKDNILVTELATPHTMKRYTNNFNGAVYGLAQDLDSSGFNRLSQKTFLDNVYLASAWTQPGGGYEGAINSGILCSKMILEEEKTINKAKSNKEYVLSPSLFMKGMVNEVDKNYAKNLVLNYKFNFTDINKTFFISIDKGKASLKNDIKNIDVEINCTYKTWYEISNNIISGEMAFRQGLLKVNGPLELFMHIPNLFKTNNNSNSLEKKNFRGDLFFFLNLIPWIFYWAFGSYPETDIVFTSFFAILFTLLISNLKPKYAKEITVLESLTTLSFSAYVLLVYTYSPYYIFFDLILPIGLIISCFFEPATSQYFKWKYPESITKTNLFKKVNIHITLVWAFVCIIQFIIAKLIFTSPIGNLAYLLNIIVILVSIIYPKKIMGSKKE